MPIAIYIKLARHNSPQEFDYAEIHSSNREDAETFATKNVREESQKAKNNAEWVFCFLHFPQTFKIG